MLRLKRILWTAVAVCFLAVSWLWDTLAPLFRAFFDLIPLERVKQAVIAFMDRLAPYPTLAVFLIPVVASEPIKLGSFWLFAQKQWVAGGTAFLFAEILRFGLAGHGGAAAAGDRAAAFQCLPGGEHGLAAFRHPGS